ncbi:Beta-fructofuranosidase, insoluble isoenzyme 3 [Triticum urartu]|uniref:Beta-fructofuranosidase, insoluble isoenzyme 3 n=1 Tax=Triticum urartu TaxID=4572 RepID=M7Z2V9_TRIUA|nr:Beta-fructofuranosidase, insoluble isoenzyme 3 [Triticum urartu]
MGTAAAALSVVSLLCWTASTAVHASHVIYPELQSLETKEVAQELRTGYHFQPPKHWINGPMYYKGLYHLFYQYNPKGAVWGNIIWAHSVSTDLIHWVALEPAIYPTMPFDKILDFYNRGSSNSHAKIHGMFVIGCMKIDPVKLRKLGPAFKKNGPVTAGTSSTASDGAAAIALVNGVKAKNLGLQVIARIKFELKVSRFTNSLILVDTIKKATVWSHLDPLQLVFIPAPFFINHCSRNFTISGHKMTVIDFIDLSDHDIIDLSSSDDETVQEDHIATQHRAASLDRQTMHVVAGEGIQDVQAVFVAASEGRQDLQELLKEGKICRLFVLPLVKEDKSLLIADMLWKPPHRPWLRKKNLLLQLVKEAKRWLIANMLWKPPHPREGSQDVQAVSEGSQDVKAVLVAATPGSQEAADSGNSLEATASPLVTEKALLDMAESHNRPRSPTSAPFPSPTSTVLKAPTFEGGDAKMVRGKVKRPRKNYHTGTPRTSPRFELKPECRNGPLEELPAEALTCEGGDAELVREKMQHPGKDYHTGTPGTSARFELKRECHNGPVEELPAEALTSEGGDAELVRGKVKRPKKNYHTGTPRTSPRFEPKHEYHNGPVEELPAEARTSEVGDAELVRGKLKHPRKNYPAGTPRTSPMFEPKRECHNGSAEEMPAKVLTSEGGDAELVRGEVKHSRKNYHTGTPRTSPRFETKRECRNGPVEELPAEALTSDGADAELVRGKVKHARKDYHTGIPRTSPRFQLKHERRKGPVEEPAADHKRFRTLEELIASPDNAESAMTPSTDSLN